MPSKEPAAHIKSIFLPLPDYKFDHGPNDKGKENPKFIGRKKIIEKLQLLLDKKNTIGKNGAYLVTGYRGMGKTSLVRESIRRINAKAKQPNDDDDKQRVLKSFEVALSQDEVREVDLLRQIAWKLDRFISNDIQPLRSKKIKDNWCNYAALVLSTLIIFLIYNDSVLFSPVWLDNPLASSNIGNALLFFGLVFLLKTLLSTVFQSDLFSKKDEEKTIEENLEQLRIEISNRLFSDVVSEERKEGVNFGTNAITILSRKILNNLSQGESTRANTQNFKKATPKEIEQYLFEIIRQIEKLREYRKGDFKIPAFVFIVDELDKVEPDYYFSPGDNESDKYIHHNSIPYHVETKARRRNEAISRLLANLKNFLNNSTAKFVFIGGRGMYDAALADIADRESFYSSIFNDVIYVPSFFKDKLSSQPGVSQLSEAYLCGILLGNSSEVINRNIHYLADFYQKRYTNELDDPKKIFKIIHTLQNFVIYLTYRSNGSPKKLIELIEKHIEVVEEKDQIADPNHLFTRNLLLPHHYENDKLFLRLTFRDQYRINLHANIYRPYLIINSKHLKSLGDKLLYSTAFLVDHVLKFHKSAFSWRNLELIPDIILSSKDPNFRQFYNEIMSFLLKQHLRETTNAIYQYKFNAKIQNEIKFSSKISEDSSAAFNFTLDESYHLKSYFKKKLAAKYKEHGEISNYQTHSHYLYSIGYINSIIGDLHFFDEEYDDAIIHYTEVLQSLRSQTNSPSAIESHNSVILVRTSLNLGLCYEKTRMYDRAYSTYRSLVLKLKLFDPTLSNESNTNPSKWEKPYKRLQLFQRPHIAILNVIEKDRQDGITYDNLERNLQEYLNFLNVEYPPGLFPLEQRNTCLNYSDLKPKTTPSRQSGTSRRSLRKKCLRKLSQRPSMSSSDKKRIVTLLADYYFSVGTMLFFKNQVFWRLLYARIDIKGNESYNSEFISNEIIKRLNTNKHYYHPSHSGYLYYYHALITFNTPYGENIKKLKSLPGCESILHDFPSSCGKLSDHMRFVTNYFQDRIYNILNSDQYDFLGNILTKLGDSVLSSLSKDDIDLKKAMPMITLFKHKLPDLSGKREFDILDNELSLKTVFGLYRLSYHCYRLAGKGYSAIYQYKKLLYVLRDTVSPAHYNDIRPSLLNDLLNIALEYQTDNAAVSNRSQLNKYRRITNMQDGYTSLIYNNLSNAPEVKEFILTIEILRIKLGHIRYSKFYIGEYSTISSMFIRVVELKFKGDQERHKTTDLINGDVDQFIQDSLFLDPAGEKYEKLKLHLANTFFCYYEILRIINTYGVNYILNHSFKASICYRLAQHCVNLEKIEKHGQLIKSSYLDHRTVCDELSELIGNNFRNSIDPFEYYDLARLHYQSAMDMHREGAVYKEMSREMYVLEDDFNDNLVHFCAANERYRINTGMVSKRLDKIDEILSNSKIYKPHNYVS